MNKVRILILALFVLLTNCSRKKSNFLVIDKFPEEVTLTGQTIESISFHSKSNVRLAVIDTFLVIQKMKDSLIHIYSTSDYRLIKALGNTGHGPNEFVFPELLKQISFDESNKSPVICIYDIERRRFSKINIKHAINNQTDQIFSELLIPDYNQYLTYFFYRDSDLLVATPEKGSRFVIYKDSTKSFQEIDFLPELGFKIREDFESAKYSSASFVNRKIDRIVSAPFFFGEIDFFSTDGQFIKSTIFETKENLIKSLSNMDEKGGWNPKNYIVDLEGDDKFVYALNYDNYQNDYVYGRECVNQSILVFDWEGNPIKKYILDTTYFIRYFAVDLKNKRFYGFCMEEPDHPIIVYN